MNIAGKITKLRNEKWDLISHIDICFNFIKADPENADLYIDDGKRTTTKILETELAIVELERDQINEKIKLAAAMGVRA